MRALRPFEPTRARPFDAPAAARFLWRVALAPSRREVDEAVDLGFDPCVERLVRGRKESERFREIDGLGERIAARDPGAIGPLRGWWLHRMVYTERPFRERMHVLWHDHFATSHAKVRDARMMLGQLRTIEENALGRFESLLLAMSRDPAMIVWLDGEENVKGRPNENFARELFELFSLGVGHYSERDIREAARAFTGWHQQDGRFRFVARAHDGGRKGVLGASGELDGADVVRIAASRPACPRFLADKLVRELVTGSPTAALLDEVAQHLRACDLDLARTAEALLRSEAMLDPRYERSRVRSPVETVVGMARSLELKLPADTLALGTSNMGQRLFEPPSVEGWKGHRAWLDSATLVARLNAAHAAVDAGEGGMGLRARALRDRYGLDDRDAVLEHCRLVALGGDIPAALDRRLEALDAGDLDRLLGDGLRILLTSPEYQLA